MPVSPFADLHLLYPNLSPILSNAASLWEPPERLPLSTWAEKNIVLSSEYAARSSNLRLFAWQRGIFDAFTDPTVEEIVLMCGTQLVKTLLIQCAIAYIVSEDPGPILLVQPKDPDAKTFSKERLSPMIRDCACLAGKISDSSREGNTILTKEFPGGSLSIVGAIAPGNLARRSIRYLMCDEVDKYPLSAGKEGDPISLAWERTSTFGSRRKRIVCCSPTDQSISRIGKEYRASDQRKPYVPCFACGHKQLLRWAQVKWSSSTAAGHRPETARYECENPDCKTRWNDLQRWAACEQAEWRAHAPFAGRAGFWISHLYAPWQSKRLAAIVSKFLNDKKDRNLLKTFINTNLAEEWVDEGEVTDPEILYGRRESYPFGPTAVIPRRGLFLTAAVDVQDNPPRLECEVVAWGRDRENWSVDYQVIQCFSDNGQALPVTSRELWDKLDQDVLQRSYPHESGHTLPIMVMCIDTGNRPKPVYEFARRHPQLAHSPAGIRLHSIRTVVPIKGSDDPLRIISSISKEDAARRRQGVRIVGIGTHCAKQETYDALKSIRPAPKEDPDRPTPGYHHFPMYELSYFQGLCSEVRVVKENGKVEYEKRAERNEPIDLKVYNRAGASLVGIDRFGEEHWLRMEEAVGETQAKVAVPVAAAVPVSQPAPTPTVVPPPALAPAPSPVPLAIVQTQTRMTRGSRGGFAL